MYKCYIVCNRLICVSKNLHLQFHLCWEKTFPTLPYWVGMWYCCPLWLSKSQYIILSIEFQLDCISIGMSALFIVHLSKALRWMAEASVCTSVQWVDMFSSYPFLSKFSWGHGSSHGTANLSKTSQFILVYRSLLVLGELMVLKNINYLHEHGLS